MKTTVLKEKRRKNKERIEMTKKKILIVEDETSIADLEKDYLELSDFDVTICNNGEEIGRAHV